MELEKYIVHNSVVKNIVETQISFDQDFNVPDSRPDIERIINKRGTVQVDNVRINDGKAQVAGVLTAAVLYLGDEAACMTGSMEFMESINAEVESADEKVQCDTRLEDLIVRVVNSRKINVRAVITVKLYSEKYEDVELPYECAAPDSGLQVKKENIGYAQLTVNSTDSLRIRCNVDIPKSSPDIAEIVWDEVDVCPVAFHMTDSGINAEVLVNIFAIYRSTDGIMMWHESQENVTQTVDVSGASADAVCFVSCRQQSGNVQIRPDADGEDRVLEAEAVCELGIHAYEEKNHEIVTDCYIPAGEAIAVTSQAKLLKLMTHNNTRCRAAGMLKTDTGAIGDICSCRGQVKVQDISYEESNVEVNGTVDVNVLCTDKSGMLYCVKGEIPFGQKIEVRGMEDFCKMGGKKAEEVISLMMNADLEKINAVKASDGIEVKASAALDVIVFGSTKRDIIDDIRIQEADKAEYMSLPLITGYIVKPGDTLWSIAKSHHTTADDIKTCNTLKGEEVNAGDRLILMKKGILQN